MNTRVQSFPETITTVIDIPPRPMKKNPDCTVAPVHLENDGNLFNVLFKGRGARILQTYFKQGMVVRFTAEETQDTDLVEGLPDIGDIRFVCTSEIEFMYIRNDFPMERNHQRILQTVN